MRMTIKNLSLVLLLVALIISLPSDNFGQKKKPIANKNKVAKAIPGDKENAEGDALYDQGTASSLNAALGKYTTAYQFYESGNQREKLAIVAVNLGITYKKLNNLQKALEHYQDALQIYEELGDNGGRGATLTNLGAIYRDAEQFQDALNYFQQALPLQRLIKSKENEAKTLNGIGESYLGLGNVTQAVNFVLQAYNIWQTLGNNQDRVRTTYNLGRIYLFNGEEQKGLNLLNRALTDSRQYNNPILEGDILEMMAQHYDAAGNLTKAVELRNQIFTAYNNSKASTVTPFRVLMSLVNLIVTYFKAGDFQTATTLTNQGMSYAARYNESYMTSYLQGNTGSILYEQGKFNESIPYLSKGIEIARQNENKSNESFYLAVLGLVYLEMDEFEKSESSLNQAKKLMPSGKDYESVQGIVLSGLIRLYAVQSEPGKVAKYINEGRSLGLDKGKTQGTIQYLAAVGYSQLQAKKIVESVNTFNLAFDIANKVGHEVEKAKIRYEASTAYLENGDVQNAVQMAQISHDFFKKIGNDRMDMKTHLTMGNGLLKLGQGQQAIANYNSALDFAQKLNDQLSQILGLTGIAAVYDQSNDFKGSIQYLNQALSIAQQTNVNEFQKFILDWIGNNYEKSGDKKKAKEFRDKAKKIKT